MLHVRWATHVLVCTACVQSDNRAFASADDDDADEEPAPAAPKSAPARPPATAGRGGGRGGTAVSGKGPKDAATRQAELRAKKLEEEAQVMCTAC